MAMRVPLTDMVEGETARVVEFLGGRGAVGRLARLGIREGAMLTMLHDPHMGGPVVISVAGSQVALGFGMATKVVVEVPRR